jgi:glyoxylase-like metal-dependent hydrolase (beta-lactamase superfamily II)
MDRGEAPERGRTRADDEPPGDAAVHRLEFGVDWPPWHAAAFLVEGDEPVLVDAGVPGTAGEEELRDGLADHGREPEEVAHVLLTHPHSDHIGQVPTLREEAAVVHAARMSRERLSRDPEDLAAGVRETGEGAGLSPDDLEEHVERALSSLERNRRLMPPGEIDHAFEYGERFEAGGLTFEPVHTPGHQEGHASFELPLEEWTALFSGDVLVEPFRAAALNVGLDRGAYGAVDEFYTAYDRLERREVDRVYPGHGPPFTDYRGVLRGSRDALDDLLDEVRGAVEAVGPASPLAVTRARVDRLEHPAPLLDTLGALGTLDRRGEVRFQVTDGVRRYRVT